MNVSRLISLIIRLESMPVEEWDFCWVRNPDCKSCGCAMGQFPYMWPDKFEFRGSTLVDKEDNFFHSDAVADFLDISYADLRSIFFGEEEFYGVSMEEVTKEMVAAKIRQLIKEHGNERRV